MFSTVHRDLLLHHSQVAKLKVRYLRLTHESIFVSEGENCKGSWDVAWENQKYGWRNVKEVHPLSKSF